MSIHKPQMYVGRSSPKSVGKLPGTESRKGDTVIVLMHRPMQLITKFDCLFLGSHLKGKEVSCEEVKKHHTCFLLIGLLFISFWIWSCLSCCNSRDVYCFLDVWYRVCLLLVNFNFVLECTACLFRMWKF